MIGLDTNVLVRYFADDDPQQSRAARALIEGKLSRESPGHVAAITLAEFAWVLKRLFAAEREEIATVIEGLLTAPNLVVEHKALAWKALRDFRASGVGFSDCLISHVNADAGCQTTVTFDKSAAKLPAFQLLR